MSCWISFILLVSHKYANLANAKMTNFNYIKLDALNILPQHLFFWAPVYKNTWMKKCNLCRFKVMLWFENPIHQKNEMLPKVKAL